MSTVDPNGLSTRDLVLELRAFVERMREEMRNRFHDFQAAWARLENRVRDLEEWQREADRRFQAAEARANKYVPLIEELVDRDTIAAEVGKAMQKSEARGWSDTEKRFAKIAIACTVFGALGTFVSIGVLIKAVLF